jgi:glycogen operon protein
VGNFPVGWSEWNGRFRDTVRAFWRGETGQLGEFASRLTGSSDLYQGSGRPPQASINFVTAHDGFTLNDLVSYDGKHNEANGENNEDGHDHNLSWNCGVEGPTDDPDVLDLRQRQRRNVLATLLLSQGVPMMLAGDELGQTQGGNNNAYCQDNELSWLDWNLSDDDERLLAFTGQLLRLRRSHPQFRRSRFFSGAHADDIMWLKADGEEFTEADWHDPEARAIGVLLNGDAVRETDARNRPIRDDTLLLLFNAGAEAVEFSLPELWGVGPWRVAFDTNADAPPESFSQTGYSLVNRSMALLTRDAVQP